MNTETNMDLVGSGWAFRLHPDGHRGIGVDGRGGIAVSRHEADINEAIRIILLTAKGERRMRPNFGCDIHNLIFHPNNATTWGLAAYYVKEALGWWEPRIDVTKIEPKPDPDDPSRLMISIEYTIKATNDERSIVYPFYLLGGRE